jgi:hypothetical protein
VRRRIINRSGKDQEIADSTLPGVVQVTQVLVNSTH